MREDAGRGWRRVVASPRPIRIVEEDAVRALLRDDFVVITVGGGGIPVVADEQGDLHGVAAVIDKDFASALLAIELGADVFMISTAVDRRSRSTGAQPEQRWVDRLTIAEAKAYLAEGTHFAAGSMAPKIEACIEFLEQGGGRGDHHQPGPDGGRPRRPRRDGDRPGLTASAVASTDPAAVSR